MKAGNHKGKYVGEYLDDLLENLGKMLRAREDLKLKIT
jgi:hypothetical protein